MDTTDDPREKNMWLKKVIVTSEEMIAFAANYPPMGVYIPKGRIKVPHRRSKVSPQTRHATKGRSHNLLMIKQSALPPIDVYRNCDVTNELKPPCQGTNAPQNCRKESWTVQSKNVVTPQYFQNHCDANNMIQIPQPVLPNNESCVLQSTPVFPPPYAETPMTNHNPFHHDMKTFMTQEVTYPTNHRYYQHLSAIAAMAWSDCNQATLKLKRIYEETAQLSRAMEPLTVFPGSIPTMQPPEYPGLPNKECVALPGVLNHNTHRTSMVRRRHLGDRAECNINQTMSQSVGLANGNLDYARQIPSKPNPISFVEHCRRPIKNPMYCDVAHMNNPLNQNAYVTRTAGEKRKICEIPQPRPSKIPRLAQPVPTFTVRYDDVSHFPNCEASIYAPRHFDSLPPPYESIQPNYNLFPGILPNQRLSLIHI